MSQEACISGFGTYFPVSADQPDLLEKLICVPKSRITGSWDIIPNIAIDICVQTCKKQGLWDIFLNIALRAHVPSDRIFRFWDTNRVTSENRYPFSVSFYEVYADSLLYIHRKHFFEGYPVIAKAFLQYYDKDDRNE